ncbi:MAG: hypothetical protein JNK64_40895 [Myxococcales bacterium]|nr:hypothetical protein [Myxococcales bacterium]
MERRASRARSSGCARSGRAGARRRGALAALVAVALVGLGGCHDEASPPAGRGSSSSTAPVVAAGPAGAAAAAAATAVDAGTLAGVVDAGALDAVVSADATSATATTPPDATSCGGRTCAAGTRCYRLEIGNGTPMVTSPPEIRFECRRRAPRGAWGCRRRGAGFTCTALVPMQPPIQSTEGPDADR